MPAFRSDFAVHYLGWSIPRLAYHGRWGAVESCLHYKKAHLLIRNESRASAEEHARADWIWEKPEERLGLQRGPTELSSSSSYPLLPVILAASTLAGPPSLQEEPDDDEPPALREDVEPVPA